MRENSFVTTYKLESGNMPDIFFFIKWEKKNSSHVRSKILKYNKFLAITKVIPIKSNNLKKFNSFVKHILQLARAANFICKVKNLNF